MRYRLVILTVCLVCCLFGLYTLDRLDKPEAAREAFSSAVIRSGASGKDVYELQGRLKHLGYFNGKVDGNFGPATLNAVKWFQWKFGMKADGVVGGKTKLKLWEATKEWKPTAADLGKDTGTGTGQGRGGGAGEAAKKNDVDLPASNNMGMTANDLKLMANAVYGESRGEPYEGQVAVAAVILNRVRSAEFPNTVSGVIFQPGAFTAVADGQIYLTPNETAAKAVKDAMSGWDPTDGCLYYFNPKTATSKWIWSRPQYKTIGQHIFCN
ncbi:spore cortex-lytic enzyme [Cohnella sp. JJ-181]|uniref:spore cortex-lytic enzyme n=1 Tax=Cohnella rhizoplanae TaxID=2974897 RepID=UPI0022FF5BC4|nr:spore cortex-lytic enzyme [Cohnella sp. JJ-181]CAI6028556.1 Spore cortex-lytic enzyme [Cohnella sp. JJ-181]